MLTVWATDQDPEGIVSELHLVEDEEDDDGDVDDDEEDPDDDQEPDDETDHDAFPSKCAVDLFTIKLHYKKSCS